MFQFIDEGEYITSKLLLRDLQSDDYIAGDSPRDLVAGFLRNGDYTEIDDGAVAAYMRKRMGSDLRDMAPMTWGRVFKTEIGFSTDREFLKGLVLNGVVAIYERGGSYRIRTGPPIEQHCSKCAFDKGNERCSQFEAWADGDGVNCMGFARKDIPTDDTGLMLVDYGHPEIFVEGYWQPSTPVEIDGFYAEGAGEEDL
ncbi:conserved hypothetical protein [Candidatus Desulfosporosinus infrequens]|uniref:Uncharacterized protein n=1 Tax=Candidatus Desulfosporosinus infrequens TaxID=2043169 RepID=A0A2U3LLU6_9FIRM|nr:conserved hypothetical protein [Candidatus Desulfosporosinus infrequens]